MQGQQVVLEVALGQELDGVAQLGGKVDVDGVNAADAASLDAGERHGHAIRDLGEDGQLVGGVGAIDVEGGVGLGVSRVLGLGQGVAVARPFSLMAVRMKLQVPLRMPWMREDLVGGQALAPGRR